MGRRWAIRALNFKEVSYENGNFNNQRGSWPCLACQVVFELKGRIALQAGHASPVKWCSKEKVLLGKWSAIAMLELQHIRLNEKVELLCKLAMGLTDFSPHR